MKPDEAPPPAPPAGGPNDSLFRHRRDRTFAQRVAVELANDGEWDRAFLPYQDEPVRLTGEARPQ